MLIQKQCSCKLTVNVIDNKFKVNNVGYWIECDCGSTNLVLNSEIEMMEANHLEQQDDLDTTNYFLRLVE